MFPHPWSQAVPRAGAVLLPPAVTTGKRHQDPNGIARTGAEVGCVPDKWAGVGVGEGPSKLIPPAMPPVSCPWDAVLGHCCTKGMFNAVPKRRVPSGRNGVDDAMKIIIS